VFDLAAEGIASRVIATADEPDHAVHRRLMLPPLKAARIAALEGDLRDFAAARVDGFVRDRGGDICAALAEPLPAWVVIRLLDLGEDALEAVRRWAMMGGDLLAGRMDRARLHHLLGETAQQYLYLTAHFDRVRALQSRGESLTATLAGGVDEGLITCEEAVGILIVLFGAAGESTASLLGSALRLLATDAELQQRLRAEPALVPRFVEEVVRLETPFKFHYRVVREDTTLCGAALRAGERLLLGWASANRDPAAHAEPDTLRLDRAQPERHLGFGYGIHYCIGAPLARLEVRVALEELLVRTRQFALDPAHPPAHMPSIMVRRLGVLRLQAR
jgi:cytochrome P450